MQRAPRPEHAAEHASSPTQIGEGIRFVRRGSAWIFPECIHNACGVDKRCPGIDASRNPECFRNLFLCSALLDRGIGIPRYATDATPVEDLHDCVDTSAF